MKRSKTLLLAAALGLALSSPARAIDNGVRRALDDLKQAYTRINNDFIRSYKGYRNQGSALEVRIDQSGMDREIFSGQCPIMSSKSYKATEALSLLPVELISMINARIVQSYNEGYRDYRDGYLSAKTTSYNWMTNEWIWDGIHLVTPFSGSASYSPAQVDRYLAQASTQIENALKDVRSFLAEDSNYFLKKTGVWPFRSEKRYLTATAANRYRELKSKFTQAMSLYAGIAEGLLDGAKAEAQKQMNVNFANVATVMMVANRLTLKLYLVQQFGPELYYTAEALVSAAYRGGYSDANSGYGYRNFDGYSTSYHGNWGWGDGYDTSGGRIYDRGDRIAGEDYYGGNGSNYDTHDNYDTTPSYDGYNTYDDNGYGTQPGGDAPVYDGGSDYDTSDSYDTYDSYGTQGSGSLPGEDF